jgi:hypothetical protein
MKNRHELKWSISDVKTTEGETMIVGGEGQEFGLIAAVTDEADAKQIIADREARAGAPSSPAPVVGPEFRVVPLWAIKDAEAFIRAHHDGKTPLLPIGLANFFASLTTAPPPQSAASTVEQGNFMTLVHRYGANPTQEGYDAIYKRYLGDCGAAPTTSPESDVTDSCGDVFADLGVSPEPDAVREALKPFADLADAMYVSGHCGGASPEDWPDKWSISTTGGKDHHMPQAHGGVLTVADFRKLARHYHSLARNDRVTSQPVTDGAPK